MFNPPYVETISEEMGEAQGNKERLIEKSWAGGANGMEVTDRLLEQVPELLSPQGTFYLVAVKENKPEEIIERMKLKGLTGEVSLNGRLRVASTPLISHFILLRRFSNDERVESISQCYDLDETRSQAEVISSVQRPASSGRRVLDCGSPFIARHMGSFSRIVVGACCGKARARSRIE